MLEFWKDVKKEYETAQWVEELSSREWEAYKPLVSIANLADALSSRMIVKHAIDCKQKKLIAKRASDDRLELLYFLKAQICGKQEECFSNKELALNYNDKIGGRTSYKDFADKISQLDILKDAKNHHGVKVYYFDIDRIEQQITLIESKS